MGITFRSRGKADTETLGSYIRTFKNAKLPQEEKEKAVRYLWTLVLEDASTPLLKSSCSFHYSLIKGREGNLYTPFLIMEGPVYFSYYLNLSRMTMKKEEKNVE